MLGRKPGDLLQGPDTDPIEVAKIGKNLRDDKSASTELLNYTKDLQPYWVQFYITPVHGVGGQTEQFISIQTDSTRRHQELEALESAKMDAERANAAKSDFLAVMSHEIRTPMNGVLGMLSALDDTRLEARQVKMLSVAKTSAQSLLIVLNDVLDYSKIEAGRLELEQTNFDPEKLITSLGHLQR